MLMESVLQLVIYAKLQMPMETVLHASRDTTSSTELVSSHPPTLLLPPISDVDRGTGTTKSALPAQRTGSSTPKTSASLFLINVRILIQLEPVLHATRDMISSTEPVNSPLSTMLSLLTLDVDHGTGTTKSALPAQRTGSSTPKTSASQLTICVTPTIKPQEPVLHASQDTSFPTELATWPTLFASHQPALAHALLAILDMCCQAELVPLLVSLPAFIYTTPNAALRNWLSCRQPLNLES